VAGRYQQEYGYLMRASYRHTSSDDKYDVKKVVSSRFYTASGQKIASCHAHGDGTWSLLFSSGGRGLISNEQLTPEIEARLEVNVLQRKDRTGKLFQYGEMIKKPDVCRRPVSENNDEKHRLRQLEVEVLNSGQLTEVVSRKKEDIAADGSRGPRQTAAGVLKNERPRNLRPQGDGSLTFEQEDLARKLAAEGLAGKEQRSLFRLLKTMSLEEQELILEKSRVLKARSI